LDRQKAIRDAVLCAIFTAYPDWRDEYGYEEDEAEELMPALDRPDQLKQMIGLTNVHVLGVVRAGVAYVGFECGCTWDEENGLGAMTHKGRVVEVGGGDVSFLDWVARRDADSGAGKKPRPGSKGGS
jgi:hypothetical protein